jgi:eukaryotic-like serine/threonine-protein kinase
LKVMKPEAALRQGARERFLREARAAAAIEDERIISIYAVDEDRGIAYLAMPLLKGSSLDKLLRHGMRLESGQILTIGREVALGLDAAHRQGLIHRDIKPANIWIEQEKGRVKILDFGLALPISEQTHLTQSGFILGTPYYMAPEQAAGESVDGRADLFSLGCILYRLSTGRLPYYGKNIMATLTSLAVRTPNPIGEINDSVPAELENLIMRLLEKDPNKRYSTGLEVAHELEIIGRKHGIGHQFDMTSLVRLEPIPVAEAVVESFPQPAASKDPFADIIDVTTELEPVTQSKQRKNRVLPWIVVGCISFLLLGGSLAIVMTILKVGSPEGTLVVEVDGNAVEEQIKGKKLIVADKKANRTYELVLEGQNSEKNLPPGEYEISVSDDTGLKLKTKEFTIVRNDKTSIRVTISKKSSTHEEPKLKLPFTEAYAKTAQEKWAKHLNIDVETENTIGLKLRLIPPGEF